MKKIFSVLVTLFIAFFPSSVFSYKLNNGSSTIDKKEWLDIYYKESVEQYKYNYDTYEKLSLINYIYNYFIDSLLRLWITNDKIKKQNFILLKDSSIELKPVTNIIFRAIINPKTKSISEIMVTVDKSTQAENFTLFYSLSRIAINMINIDITKYDVDTIYNKLSIDQIAIDRSYTANLIKDGIDYSIFYVGDSVFFILKKTQLETSHFFNETGEEKELANYKDKFANEDEFFDINNRDLSQREDVAKANDLIDNLQKKSIPTKEQTSDTKKETINNKSKVAPIIKNESYKVNSRAYPPYTFSKEGFTEKKIFTEQKPIEKKKESTVYWK